MNIFIVANMQSTVDILKHLKVRPWIDAVFTFTLENGEQKPFDMMVPADDYETMTLEDGFKAFNITFPKGTKYVSYNMLAYGLGGLGEYKIDELLSEPIGTKHTQSNIIVNTPTQICAVIIEFPKTVQELLGFNKWLYLVKLDKNQFKTNNKFNNHELMARGVDPEENAKTYVGQITYSLPEWARDRPDEFTRHINTFVINVHCFEGSVMKDMEL
jgi:hypothetical protein